MANVMTLTAWRPTMSQVCRIVACVAFALAIVGVPALGVVPMIPLGLGLWCLSSLVP